MNERARDLARIREALEAAAEAVRPFTPGAVAYRNKSSRGDPVTAADHAINDVLLTLLPERGEGWLSEETVDDARRLECRRLWVVDPLDGTREFVDGIPEWCISIGLVEEGRPVAGGIYNPVTDELFLGSVETGVTLNGRPVRVTGRRTLEGAVILASRSEWRRGEWARFADAPFRVAPCGSVAYKLARVAAGLAHRPVEAVDGEEGQAVHVDARIAARKKERKEVEHMVGVEVADKHPPDFGQLDPGSR